MGRIGAIRDVELYRALLGLTALWTVAGVDIDLPRQQGWYGSTWERAHTRFWGVGGGGGGLQASPAGGGIWTAHSSRPGSRPTCRGSTAAATSQAGAGALGAEPGSQFTALFERLSIDLLRECSITG